MTDKDANNTSTDKPEEVAPYMISAKKGDKQETVSQAGIVIPMVLTLVLTIVIISSFYEDEYKTLMAYFNTDKTAVTEVTLDTKKVDTNIETAIAEVTTASTKTTAQPEQITLYNPYLGRSPQVYAPSTLQVPHDTYGYRAPYGAPPQQAQSYNDMLQKRQKMMDARHKIHNAVLQRIEKNRTDRRKKMEQRRAEAQKKHAERLKRIQEAHKARTI
jgi:hypothetical protein